MSPLLLEEKRLHSEIRHLLTEKNALLLAHYYQDESIQDLADFIGDSLELAKRASESSRDLIIFCGVHFMAETVKAINPDKRVIVPDLDASCSLAESCTADAYDAFARQHPDCVRITYINSSLEVKGMSDVVCTSSNAENVIRSVPADKSILFAPDKNLGKYLAQKTGRDLLLWDGACAVHEAFELDKIIDLVRENPGASIIAHPESPASILELAVFVGSTSALLRYVVEDVVQTYIVATEAGILHKMRQLVPKKKLIPAPVAEDNTCACSECAYMKMNTLQKLYDCIAMEGPEIRVDEAQRKKALEPIRRMLEFTA